VLIFFYSHEGGWVSCGGFADKGESAIPPQANGFLRLGWRVWGGKVRGDRSRSVSRGAPVASVPTGSSCSYRSQAGQQHVDWCFRRGDVDGRVQLVGGFEVGNEVWLVRLDTEHYHAELSRRWSFRQQRFAASTGSAEQDGESDKEGQLFFHTGGVLLRAMATRQVEWARLERSRLTAILGGRCRACGTDQCLTFDCIRPTGPRHHRLSSVGRICFYREQMRRGNVQLLCSLCNSKKGAKQNPVYRPCVSASLNLNAPELANENSA
jgi:hypothetical protein